MGKGIPCKLTDSIYCKDCCGISLVKDLTKVESSSYAVESTLRRLLKPVFYYCCTREYPCACDMGDGELFVPPLSHVKLVPSDISESASPPPVKP